MIEIEKHLEQVEKRIEEACKRSGRSRNEVTLIAVSKTQPLEVLQEAIQCGISVFGENKVQELLKKYEELKNSKIEWHMIGHLQGNKVKYLPGIPTLIHSLDSLKLAREIERVGAKENIIIDVLVQMNLSGEESKYGLSKEEVEDFMKEVSKFPHIRVKGLMTVPPYVEDMEENRHYFRTLRKIMVDLNEKNIDNIDMNVLSMGMTDDFEVAIEEGATHVRIGTGLFGKRDYQL